MRTPTSDKLRQSTFSRVRVVPSTADEWNSVQCRPKAQDWQAASNALFVIIGTYID